MTHLTFDQLSELADNPASNAQEAADPHLGECATCRETLHGMRELLGVAHALPREIAPPPEVWNALHRRMALARRRGSPAVSRGWVPRGWVAAAAAVVLLAGAAVIAPFGRSKGKAVPVVATSPAVLSVEKNYSPTLNELGQTLDAQRPGLAATTVRVVDQTLATIDTAIAEARSALSSDPGNGELVDILSSHYERKVDLLQRATELAPSS
jgi:predicted anti-sigma-YlaC factor YlaD